jgi:hypothetical protein
MTNFGELRKAEVQPQIIPTASSADRDDQGPSGRGITWFYPGSCKWTSENAQKAKFAECTFHTLGWIEGNEHGRGVQSSLALSLG